MGLIRIQESNKEKKERETFLKRAFWCQNYSWNPASLYFTPWHLHVVKIEEEIKNRKLTSNHNMSVTDTLMMRPEFYMFKLLFVSLSGSQESTQSQTTISG